MKRIFLTSTLLAFILMVSNAQPMPSPGTDVNSVPKIGTIAGKIVENGSNVPLEYANVAVFSKKDSSLAGGAIADAKGVFSVSSLTPGEYYLEAKFIGYNITSKRDITITGSRTSVDLGTLKLEPASENIAEVKVIANNKAIAYDIDKKVIDPAQFPTAANGTAVDILANTPSVTVDIEGNVALRGSSSFTVLIDGRPTPFDPADALQQIPASSIRNIEIITNPSAKFDPDGNAGIININTKKSKINGFSGIVNGSLDSYGSITGDVLLNYRAGKFNFFAGANRANRYGGGKTEGSSMAINTDTIFTKSLGEGERGRSSYSLKTGFDYYLNDKNTISFNVDFNGRAGQQISSLNFEEWNTSGYQLNSLTDNKSNRNGNNVAYSLDYKKTFKREGQELTAFLFYETGNGEEYSFFEQFNESKVLLKGQKSWEGSIDNQYRAKVDYIHPFNAKTKLETGFQSRIVRDTEWNDVLWYTTATDYTPGEGSPNYSSTSFSRDIHALYAMFNQVRTVWGYQLGMRTEYTDRTLSYSEVLDDYVINRLDFFPTAHLSFNLPAQQQATVSYTRRIERPRGFALEPFLTYVDAYNVRKGNPGILPEYIDSYEMGYQKQLTGGFISTEAYFRQTNNKMEQVQSVYSNNVILNTVDNVGTDYSLGIELMLNYKLTKWWMVNLMGNVYNYRMEGEFNGRVFDTESNNWSSRFNNTFTVGKNTKLQLDGMYNSPTVTAQGRREGFMFTNVAVRQDFLNNKLSATFAVRDVLNTAKFEFKSEGTNFYTQNKFDMRSPVFSLTLSYKINNFKQKNNRGDNGDMNGGMMDMGNGEL